MEFMTEMHAPIESGMIRTIRVGIR
jgi:hypothetical protein